MSAPNQSFDKLLCGYSHLTFLEKLKVTCTYTNFGNGIKSSKLLLDLPRVAN